jgi:hypothetical protein
MKHLAILTTAIALAATAAGAQARPAHCHRGYVRHGQRCVKLKPRPRCDESCQQERRVAQGLARELAERLGRTQSAYIQTPEWAQYAAEHRVSCCEAPPAEPPRPAPEATRPPLEEPNPETVTTVAATAVVCERIPRLSTEELDAILGPKLVPIEAKLGAATKSAHEELARIRGQESTLTLQAAAAKGNGVTLDELKAIEREVAEELTPFAGDGFKLARAPFEATIAAAEAVANGERRTATLEAEAAMAERVAHDEESCAPQFPLRPLYSVSWRSTGLPIPDAEVSWGVLLDGKPTAAWTVGEIKAHRVQAQATYITLNPFVWGESSATLPMVMR